MSRISLVFIAALSIGSIGCSGETPSSPSKPGDDAVEIAGLTISNAVVTAASSEIAAARAATGSAYVSAVPHTFRDDAHYASITNQTAGTPRVNRTVIDGGFDPVKVDGKEGDSLLVSIFSASGDLLSIAHTRIPARRPPRVVRTNPGKGRVDVALNTLVEVVFSEPISKTSVTPASVRLVKTGVDVAGTLAVSDDGLVVRFTPALGTLESSTSYSLILTPALRDLDSEQLEDAPVIEFSTASSAISGEILIVVETSSVSGGPIDPDGYFIQLDALPPEHVETGAERRFDVSIGLHSVNVFGMSDNCIAADSRRSVDVFIGATTTVRFQVQCTPPPPLQGVLVFLSERDGNSEIYTSNADGTGLRRLTNNSFAEFDPEWSPDGKKIAFARSRSPEQPSEFFWPNDTDIYIMDADGSNVIRLTEDGLNYHPVWSPDGSKIAYSGIRNGNVVINILGIGGPPTTPVTVGYDRGWNTDPAWSPDGQYIVFASDWYAFDFATLLFRVRADGSEEPTLYYPADLSQNSFTSYYYLQPSWSPDGSRVAFAECDYFYICWGTGRIVVAGANRSGFARLVETSYIESTTWSPDGRYIAYSSQTCRLCSPPSISYVSPDGLQKGLIISNAFSPSWRPSPR